MRIYLEATKSIYFCIAASCNYVDIDGICQVSFKLIDGMTLIVDVPVGDYDKLIKPRLLMNGYYSIKEYYRHDFILQT